MPAPIIAADIKQEIRAIYSQTNWSEAANTTLLDACGEAAHFLATQEPTISTILARLESEVGHRILKNMRLSPRLGAAAVEAAADSGKEHWQKQKRQWDAANPSKGGNGAVRAAKNNSFSKVVSDCIFEGISTAGGFSPAVPKFITFIQTTQFNQNLAAKRHWKDPGVAPAHGEFTHQIQWYVLVRQYTNKIAGLDLSTFFERVGTVSVANTTLPSTWPVGASGLGLWEILFDRGAGPFPNDNYGAYQGSLKPNDFRCPDSLLAYIIKKKDQLPAVSSFLAGRQAKREAEFSQANEILSSNADLRAAMDRKGIARNSDNAWSFVYLSRKMLKKPNLAGVTVQEYDRMADIIIDSGII
jgi:hypothetical protein